MITVVIPCYNHSKYVERAILSVYAQTYSDIQLVVIDDGSIDSSIQVIERMREELGFVLLTQKNQGVCKALNRAIKEAAKGEYIALLASDDFWHPDKLRLQMNAFKVNPSSRFCFTQALEFVSEDSLEKAKVFPKRCLSGDVLKSVFIRQHVPAGTMLFKRSLYDELGGFDESLKEEDWDFVIRSSAATPFASVNIPLLYYRSHNGNTMRTRSRSEIFKEKAKILSKNFNLVSPGHWLFVLLLHFSYDLIFMKICSFGRVKSKVGR